MSRSLMICVFRYSSEGEENGSCRRGVESHEKEQRKNRSFVKQTAIAAARVGEVSLRRFSCIPALIAENLALHRASARCISASW